MMADPSHQRASTQPLQGSEEASAKKMEEISGGLRDAAELQNTEIDYAWDYMGCRSDLQQPVSELMQGHLLRSGGHLKELPQLAQQDTHLGRSSRLQGWRLDVQQVLGAQNPIFKEHWIWCWSTAQQLYREWRGLDRTQRIRWRGHRGVPLAVPVDGRLHLRQG